jgi:hypothetical protein
MEPHSRGVGDSVDKAVEEVGALVLTALFGVVALSFEDGEELRSGLEEAASVAHTLEGTVDRRPGRVGVSRATRQISIVSSSPNAIFNPTFAQQLRLNESRDGPGVFGLVWVSHSDQGK